MAASRFVPRVWLITARAGWPDYEDPAIMVHSTCARETAAGTQTGEVRHQMRLKTLRQGLRRQGKVRENYSNRISRIPLSHH
jgi:hypothetical protein